MTDFGIDVSHHNVVNDWNAVRGNNITFASVKLTESTDFADPAAAGHVRKARAAGIHVGGYHFARNTDVAGQVHDFATRLKELELTGSDAMAPMLDMEATTLRPRADAFIADFIGRLRAETGVRQVLVYANLDWFRTVLHPARWLDNDVLLWIARFNGDPGNPGFAHPNLALHQHSDRGRVPGIPGFIDRDATVGRFGTADLLISGPAPVLLDAPFAAPAVDDAADDDAAAADDDRTPAEILDIGSGGSQNHFNVGIGYSPSHPGHGSGPTEHTDITQARIVDNGFEDSPFFTPNDSGTAVQFQVFMDGGRTPNTKYPRSELRELKKDDGKKASWDADDGTHIMEGKTRVVHLQPNRSRVTIAQIHDDKGDTLGIKVDGKKTSKLRIIVAIGGDDAGTLVPSYTLGDEIAWRIEVKEGSLKIFIDGQLRKTATFHGDKQYFKAGAYPQSSVKAGGKESASEFCRLELRDLRVTHSGGN